MNLPPWSGDALVAVASIAHFGAGLRKLGALTPGGRTSSRSNAEVLQGAAFLILGASYATLAAGGINRRAYVAFAVLAVLGTAVALRAGSPPGDRERRPPIWFLLIVFLAVSVFGIAVSELPHLP